MSIAEILWLAGALIAVPGLIWWRLVDKSVREKHKLLNLIEGVWIFAVSTYTFILAIYLVPLVSRHAGYISAGNFGGLGFLIVGIVAVPTTAVVALWRYRIADKQTNIDQQRNRAEALAKASELLGNREVAAQQGGLFALGQLARSSKEDHPAIMKVVAGFIKDCAPKNKEPSIGRPAPAGSVVPDGLVVPDRSVAIEAAANVLRDREFAHDISLDRLVERKEWRFDLSNIRLENIDFTGVDLRVANMSDSVFKDCVFENADFSGANFIGADLENSDLTSATFDDADLTKADLSLAKNLTQEQINSAMGNEETKLPGGVEMPASWKNTGCSD